MLVLSRNVSQGIWIGDDVRVVVVDVRGNHVRLGIQAPDEVSVDRDEVRERKDLSRRQRGRDGL